MKFEDVRVGMVIRYNGAIGRGFQGKVIRINHHDAVITVHESSHWYCEQGSITAVPALIFGDIEIISSGKIRLFD